MRSGRKLQDQLDSIKSLANLTKTVHVLVGTYELLPFRNLSGQLSRRSVDIHFPRYRADRREDYLAFQSVLFTFQRHLPLVGNTDLVKDFDFCYERSIGCVGVLKDWLTRALAMALSQEALCSRAESSNKHPGPYVSVSAWPMRRWREKPISRRTTRIGAAPETTRA